MASSVVHHEHALWRAVAQSDYNLQQAAKLRTAVWHSRMPLLFVPRKAKAVLENQGREQLHCSTGHNECERARPFVL